MDRPARARRTGHPTDTPSMDDFAFVRACVARAAPDASMMTRVDPARVAAIAHRHQVVPLVVEAYRRAEVLVPAAIARRHAPLAPLALAREAVRLRALFEAEGIAPLFLKGSTLAMLAFGSLDARQFGDIDLLVRATDAPRAATLLACAGYRLPGVATEALAAHVARLVPFAKDIALEHPGTRHIVELHWRTSDNPNERAAHDDAVQMVELSPGVTLPTLGTEALFAYLCAHGAAHLWARLRWLGDIAALVARSGDGGTRLWRAAVARGQGRAAASAILLAHRFLALPLPPGFVAPRSLRLRILVAGATRAIGAGGGATDLAHTGWRGWAETGAKLLLTSGTGDLKGWSTRLLFSVEPDERVGASRLWHITHPLRRIPRLIRRRRERRLRRP